MNPIIKKIAVTEHRQAIKQIQAGAEPKAFMSNKEAFAKIAALETQIETLKVENARLKGSTAKPAAAAKLAPLSAPTEPTAGTITAEQFTGAPLLMERPEWNLLGPSQKADFVKRGGRLV